jgi:hypothetical protein
MVVWRGILFSIIGFIVWSIAYAILSYFFIDILGFPDWFIWVVKIVTAIPLLYYWGLLTFGK